MVSLKANDQIKGLNKKTLHYENDISVERVAENSAQASIFFG